MDQETLHWGVLKFMHKTWRDDKRLMDAFLVLEQKCDPVYRAWRRTENYSLEDMRRILLRLRGSTETWPPMN